MSEFKKKRGDKKNIRTKARNIIRKEENIAKMNSLPKRTPAEQLRVLDNRLGKGVGATKERAKLTAQLNK